MLISSDPDDTDDDQNYEVEAIVKHRHDEAGRLEYRIKWKGFETSYNTWEPEVNLDNCQDILNEYLVANGLDLNKMRSMLQTSPLQLEHTAQSCLRVPMTQSEDVDDDDNRPLFEQTMRKHGTHGNDTSTKPNPTTNSRKKAKTTKATSAAKHDMVSATKKAADAPSKAINGSGNRSSKNTGPTAPTTSTWAANRLTAPEPPSQDNRMETDGETPPAPTSSIPSPASTVSSPSFGSSLSSSSQSTTQGPPSSAALSGHASQTPPAPSCQPSLPVFPPAASTTISPASARGMRPIRPNLSLSPTASSSSTNTTPPLARALLLPRPPTSNQAHNQTSLLAISSNHPTTSLVPIRRGRPRTRSASASPMSSSSSSSSSPPTSIFSNVKRPVKESLRMYKSIHTLVDTVQRGGVPAPKVLPATRPAPTPVPAGQKKKRALTPGTPDLDQTRPLAHNTAPLDAALSSASVALPTGGAPTSSPATTLPALRPLPTNNVADNDSTPSTTFWTGSVSLKEIQTPVALSPPHDAGNLANAFLQYLQERGQLKIAGYMPVDVVTTLCRPLNCAIAELSCVLPNKHAQIRVSWNRYAHWLCTNEIVGIVRIPSRPTEVVGICCVDHIPPSLMPQDSSPAQQRRMVAVYINDLSPDQPREIDRARKINFLPLSWIHLSKFLGLPEKLTDAIVDYGVDIIVHGQSGIALAVKKVVDENACNPPIATSSVREVVHLCDRQTIFSSLKELKQQDVKNNRHTFYEFGQRSLTDLSILPPKEFFPRGKAGLITTDIQNLIDNPFLLSKIVNTVKMRNEYSVGQSWKFVLHPHFLYQLQQSSSGKAQEAALNIMLSLAANDTHVADYWTGLDETTQDATLANTAPWFESLLFSMRDEYRYFEYVDALNQVTPAYRNYYSLIDFITPMDLE